MTSSAGPGYGRVTWQYRGGTDVAVRMGDMACTAARDVAVRWQDTVAVWWQTWQADHPPILDLAATDQWRRYDIRPPCVRWQSCQRAARNAVGAPRGPTLTSVDVNFRALTGARWGCSEINESHRMGGPRSDGCRAGKVRG